MTTKQILPALALIAAAAAASVVRAANGPLIMGVFPRLNASETTTRYAPLAGYLGQQIGVEVKLFTSKDFETFWQGVTERRTISARRRTIESSRTTRSSARARLRERSMSARTAASLALANCAAAPFFSVEARMR